VSRDFEVDRNVSCEESTVSPIRGKFVVKKIPVSQLRNGGNICIVYYTNYS